MKASAAMGDVPAELIDGVRERLARDAAPLTPQLVAQALREQGRPVGDATVLAVHDALHRDVVGAGPLEPLLRLDGVTDVLVNGATQVWIDRGAGLERTGITFPDDASVRRLAQRLAAAGGRRLDDASPYVDLRLPDGTRFHAVLAPLSRPGTVLSLRVPRQRVFTMDELVAAGAVPRAGVALLQSVVQRRLALLISGGTGSGKTTLLNALLSMVEAGNDSSWWRTPRSCDPSTGTWWPWKHGRPTSRARVRSPCAPWCGRHSGCVRTCLLYTSPSPRD